ncbi:MAG: hypothetical protein P8172_13920, partial [Gammaproteobacteria bacterium]
MPLSTGNSSLARKLGVIDSDGSLTRGGFFLLLGLGAGIVVLKEVFRYPLGLPGHHGVEAMALLATARLTTDYRWAATVAAAGAATTAAAIGTGGSALVPMLYLLPGLVIDTGVMLVPGWRRRLLWLPVIAAVGHATKPVAKWIALGGTDVHFGSMVNGLPYPLATHLLFGFTGALV